MMDDYISTQKSIYNKGLRSVVVLVLGDFVHTLKGGRQFKPPNQFSQFQFENSNCQTETSSSSVVPVGKPKRKPRIEPGSSRFGSLVRRKPYGVGIGGVPIRNVGIDHGPLLRDLASWSIGEMAPLGSERRGRVCVAP